MELIIILPILIVFFYFFYRKNEECKSSNPIIKIDGKNWIVDNEIVSFEEDTPILRLRQQQEDDKHYRAYEQYRLKCDREDIFEEYMKTTEAINKRPVLKECITPEKLEAITEEYKYYLKKCSKLGEDFKLTKEEYLVKKENPIYCISFRMHLSTPHIGGYMIHNEATARYYKGNMQELMAKEFKEKWY